jgi:hypothetical protein
VAVLEAQLLGLISGEMEAHGDSEAHRRATVDADMAMALSVHRDETSDLNRNHREALERPPQDWDRHHHSDAEYRPGSRRSRRRKPGAGSIVSEQPRSRPKRGGRKPNYSDTGIYAAHSDRATAANTGSRTPYTQA